jgi:hypothetical protein
MAEPNLTPPRHAPVIGDSSLRIRRNNCRAGYNQRYIVGQGCLSSQIADDLSLCPTISLRVKQFTRRFLAERTNAQLARHFMSREYC